MDTMNYFVKLLRKRFINNYIGVSMSEIEEIIINRDGISTTEAYNQLMEARMYVKHGEDPDEVLRREFGLEPDYIFDIVEMC